MRILSLTPSATEIVYLLGLADHLIGRSHDSDYPAEAKKIPVVFQNKIPQQMTSLQKAKTGKEAVHHGGSFFHVDSKKANKLKPDLVLSNELCPVCVPKFTKSQHASMILEAKTTIVSLQPRNLGDVLDNILLVGKYTGAEEIGRQAAKRLGFRMEQIVLQVKDTAKPTVVIIEKLEPTMVAGLWTPEMAAIAGGRVLLSKTAENARFSEWYEIVNCDPDILILAPGGLDVSQAKKEMFLFKHKPNWEKLRAVKAKRVYYMNGDAYLNRPGPRLADGIEIMAKIFHPHIFGWPTMSEAQLII